MCTGYHRAVCVPDACTGRGRAKAASDQRRGWLALLGRVDEPVDTGPGADVFVRASQPMYDTSNIFYDSSRALTTSLIFKLCNDCYLCFYCLAISSYYGCESMTDVLVKYVTIILLVSLLLASS